MAVLPSTVSRFSAIDALRGAACVWMAVFHFCFDLSVFGWRPDWNFYRDPFWLWQRVGILSTFLFCAGLGQGIAISIGQSWARFWRRWWQVAAGAILVSIGTYWAFGARFVYFGTLHGIAVMLLLVRVVLLYLRPRLAPRLLLGFLLALAAVCLGGFGLYQQLLQAGHSLPAAFDAPYLTWLGLVSHKPPTEDFVPLLPWLSAVLLGCALGLQLPSLVVQRNWRLAAPRSMAALVWLGRHSLSFYLLHQPVFWGLLYAASYFGLRP